MNQFGITGQNDSDYNYFIGRGKKKAQARKPGKRRLKKALKKAFKRINAIPSTIVKAAAPVVQQVQSIAADAAEEQNYPAEPQEEQEPAPPPPPPAPMEDEEPTETETEYNNFGIGKRARERRRIKNEERKAAVDRTKVETSAMQKITDTSPPSTNVSATVHSGGGDKEDGLSVNTVILIAAGAVVAIGACILVLSSRRSMAA
jgi:hypothetical protein